ncbi:BtrH N-terminal domain-containing protein [Enterococcus sp. LJL128]
MKVVLEEFVPQGGHHCITNAVKQVFAYYGHPMTEAMIFGLGEGLDFTYVNLANAPLVSGRSKTIDFEKILAKNLGIDVQIKKSRIAEKAEAAAKKELSSGHPLLIYVDMAYLNYLQMEDAGHFGGHSIVLFGYDDENELFYVSDRDQTSQPIHTPKGLMGSDYHLVGFEEIKCARSSRHRPFPANNQAVSFDLSNFKGVTEHMLIQAISNTCERMLFPEAKLKGISGIEKFSREIKRWSKFDSQKLQLAAVTNYFQINHRGGTGGGIFRKLFGTFLIESSNLLRQPILAEIGNAFVELAQQWDRLADSLWALSENGNVSALLELSEVIYSLYQKELMLLNRLKKEIELFNKNM